MTENISSQKAKASHTLEKQNVEGAKTKEMLGRYEKHQVGGLGVKWAHAILAGLAAGVVSLILTSLLFAAGSPVLFSPLFQSRKVIDVYSTIQPLPLLATNQAAFGLGWVTLGVVRSLVFAWLFKSIPGNGIRKGLNWGLILWLTMIMFAEFFTAINLLGEPLYLVSFELSLLLTAFLAEGAVFAAMYGRAWNTKTDR